MKKIIGKLRLFWYFKVLNKTLYASEKGGFKVRFRRFSMEIRTVSGNFKARWTAAEYPYAYLLSAVNEGKEETVWGFAERIYAWSMCLLREQRLVNDFDRAFSRYSKRLASKPSDDDGMSESTIMEGEKNFQEYMELPEGERKKIDRETDKKLKKARNLQKKAEKIE